MPDPAKTERHAGPLRGRRRYTDEQLLDAVRGVASRNGGRVTVDEYAAAYERREVPTIRTLFLRFGTWNDTLRRAGLPTRPDNAQNYSPWTRDQCLDAVGVVMAELGRFPSVEEYERRTRGVKELPSAATVRGRCDGWTGVVAGLRARGEL